MAGPHTLGNLYRNLHVDLPRSNDASLDSYKIAGGSLLRVVLAVLTTDNHRSSSHFQMPSEQA